MADTDRTTLLDLWRRMVNIRRFEERVHDLTMAKELEGYTHTAYGEEATAVGVISLLREDDLFNTTYRNHHHAIARDMPLEAVAAELMGKQSGVIYGRGGSMHVADQELGMIGGMGIVAAGLPIAAGAALAFMRQGRDSVVVSFFGDGAVHQGAWHEALDFAALLAGAGHLLLREQPLCGDDRGRLPPQRHIHHCHGGAVRDPGGAGRRHGHLRGPSGHGAGHRPGTLGRRAIAHRGHDVPLWGPVRGRYPNVQAALRGRTLAGQGPARLLPPGSRRPRGGGRARRDRRASPARRGCGLGRCPRGRLAQHRPT